MFGRDCRGAGVLCALRIGGSSLTSAPDIGSSLGSANARHSYAFPRIYAIMNDGTKQYNSDKDGQGQEIGSCSVSSCTPGWWLKVCDGSPG